MFNGSVVLIDDDDITLELVGGVLSSMTDGEVYEFSNSRLAKSFIETAEVGTYSLIICDWEMPKVNGLDILCALRALDKQTPFLMLTGNTSKEHVISASKAGVSDYMAKPFTIEALVSKVKSLLKPAPIAG